MAAPKSKVGYRIGTGSTVTYLPNGTGAVRRSVEGKVREDLSVTDFGATGDGVTDDTAAIQKALDAARLTGRKIDAPAGTYVVTSTLTWHTTTDRAPGPHIIGAGRFATTFDNRVADGPMLSIQGTTSLTFQHGGTLQDFTITTTTSPASSSGLLLRALYQFGIENVRIRGLSGDGIRVAIDLGDNDGSVYLLFSKLWIENNGGLGIDIEAAATENSWTVVRDSFIQNNALGGMRYTGLEAEFTNVAFEINGSDGAATFGGLQLNKTAGGNIRNVRMQGCDFGHNFVTHLDIQSCQNFDARNTQFFSQIDNAITHGVKIGGSGESSTVVRNTRFTNSYVRTTQAGYVQFEAGSDALDITIDGTYWDVWDDLEQTKYVFATVQGGTRLMDGGVYAFGTEIITGAVRGDTVFQNNRGIRMVNGANNNTHVALLMDASSVLVLGGTGVRNKVSGPSTNVNAGRFNFAKGTAQAAANDLTLTETGNVFHITGATQINAITTTQWQAGSEICLIFDSTPTVKHNTAGGASTAVLLLAAGADFVASANDTLTLVYDGTSWFEKCRTVI